jgi:hypothetical protein
LCGELLGSEEKDGLPRLCCFDAESDREVSLANAWGADEKDVLGSGEELQRGEFTDELLVDLALEDKVKFMLSST